MGVLNRSLKKLKKLHDSWGFEILPEYVITLTKYGPGVKALKNEGKILLRTDASGKFARSLPVQSVVREAVCMGISQPLKSYELTRKEKDRIADIIILSTLHEELPDYKEMSAVDTRVDKYINQAPIEDLVNSVRAYVESKNGNM